MAITSLLFAGLLLGLLFDGDNYAYLYLACLTLIATLGYLTLFGRDNRPFAWTPLVIVLALYAFWSLLGYFWSQGPFLTTVGIWWHTGFILTFLVASLAAQPVHRTLNTALIVACLLLTLFSLVQYYGLGEAPRSFFLNKNSNAAFLILLLVPVTAAGLVARTSRTRTLVALLTGFLVVHTVALTGSRAAMGGLVVAMALLVWLNRPLHTGKKLGVFAAVLLAGLLSAELINDGRLVSRTGVAMATPTEAAHSRVLIWQQSWEMFRDSPWWGTGKGTYPFLFSSYRHPDDTSQGTFAHNDPLQIAIESGIPGLMLFLVVFVLILLRLRRPAGKDADGQTEANALGAALLGALAHAQFSFNYSLFPTLLLIGLYLGRFDQLTAAVRTPAPGPRATLSRPILAGILLIPALHLSAVIAGERALAQGKEAVGAGNLEAAEQLYLKASRYNPSDDRPLGQLAWVYGQAIAHGELTPTASMTLFERAVAALDRADELNPLRSETAFIRARLYAQEELERGLIEHAYAQAVQRDVLNDLARLSYVRFLLDWQEYEQAEKLLAEGRRHRIRTPHTAPYYELYLQRIETEKEG